MAILTESQVRKIAKSYLSRSVESDTYRTEDSFCKSLLRESDINFSDGKKYDIFLSHSFLDKELILGIKLLLEKYDLSVYVDWIDDSNLDRKNVTKENVMLIKKRMESSSSLIYIVTDNSADSKWMPWELGFMDGFTNKVAIFPISESLNGFKEHEYLNTYPYIDEANLDGTSKKMLWVNDSNNKKKYSDLSSWIINGSLKEHNK